MPKSRFTTDSAGRVPADVALFPSTVYRIEPVDGPPVARLNDVEQLIAWVSDCVLGDLRTLRRGIDQHIREPKSGFGGGNFLLFAGCLMALEYFARIYVADGDAVTRVRKYAQTFLAPINSKYVVACGILWRAARNGMIHGSWPRRLCIEGDTAEYKFAVGNEAGDAHLSSRDDQICVSGPRLLADLEASATGGFSDWLRNESDAGALERAQPRILQVKSADSEAKNLRVMAGWARE